MKFISIIMALSASSLVAAAPAGTPGDTVAPNVILGYRSPHPEPEAKMDNPVARAVNPLAYCKTKLKRGDAVVPNAILGYRSPEPEPEAEAKKDHLDDKRDVGQAAGQVNDKRH